MPIVVFILDHMESSLLSQTQPLIILSSKHNSAALTALLQPGYSWPREEQRKQLTLSGLAL
jgi:hypothetical protein